MGVPEFSVREVVEGAGISLGGPGGRGFAPFIRGSSGAGKARAFAEVQSHTAVPELQAQDVESWPVPELRLFLFFFDDVSERVEPFLVVIPQSLVAFCVFEGDVSAINSGDVCTDGLFPFELSRVDPVDAVPRGVSGARLVDDVPVGGLVLEEGRQDGLG